ncbi:MAG: hypothetical protein M3N93_05330 [Acidobacteriota bacterium]|nr:hypothetical protein [Acidobacteriota bacterium]
MIPPQFLRFLLPDTNPLGFAADDFIFLGLAAMLTAAFLLRAPVLRFSRSLAPRTAVCMSLLFALPILLRLALLAHHPVPAPLAADDFSYLLLGDTLAHLRLANAMHPMRRFFETVFILQSPSYSSIYPLGQGMVLGAGQLLLHQPWAGVVVSVGLLAALCYWMLRAWAPPVWALLGGVLAAFQFGPLSPWMNTYWGGAVSGIAGCLIFGAIPRRRSKAAILLGLGLGLQLLTRPFEFALLLPVVLLFRLPRRTLTIAALVLLPAAGLTLLQNKQVTGSWLTLPYQLSRYQYGIPATFTVQPNPLPHQPLTIEQQVDYDFQVAVHGPATDTFRGYFSRLLTRIRFYGFFFPAPLYLVLPAFLLCLRQNRFRLVTAALAILWLGGAFYPYFYPHYIAAATCLFVLIGIESLRQLTRIRFGRELAGMLLTLCFAYFGFWYGIYASGSQSLLAAIDEQDTFNEINTGDPEGRLAIDRTLQQAPGQQLVFIHFSPSHGARDWIYNSADIDRSRIVRAIDLGPAEDAALRRYYPDRRAWLLEADTRPPRLSALPPQP